MSKQCEIRCYDYVNHSYAQVRDALSEDALAVFQSATKAAASRAQSIASELRADIRGIGVEADISICVKNVEEKAPAAMSAPVTRLQIEWEAATMPRLFPLMKAEISIYPLTATETQLDFSGLYEPPLGPLGKAVNAIIGHRIAEVSVHRFVGDVAGYLQQALAWTTSGARAHPAMGVQISSEGCTFSACNGARRARFEAGEPRAIDFRRPLPWLEPRVPAHDLQERRTR